MWEHTDTPHTDVPSIFVGLPGRLCFETAPGLLLPCAGNLGEQSLPPLFHVLCKIDLHVILCLFILL